MDLNPSGAAQGPHPYIICLEVIQVSDDANPDKECRRSKQNAAQIVVCEILGNEKTDILVKYSIPLISGTPCLELTGKEWSACLSTVILRAFKLKKKIIRVHNSKCVSHFLLVLQFVELNLCSNNTLN